MSSNSSAGQKLPNLFSFGGKSTSLNNGLDPIIQQKQTEWEQLIDNPSMSVPDLDTVDPSTFKQKINK